MYLYDSSGNQTTTIQNPKYNGTCFYVDSQDSITRSKQYDSQGNVIQEIDGEGLVTKYEYDAEDRLVKVTLPDSENVTTIEYDKKNADGTTSTIATDANGNKTETATNAQDLTVYSKNLGNGSITPITSQTEYDAKDNVTKQTDSKGNYKTFEYDDMDRNVAINYFDEKGNATFRTEYVYDINNKVTDITYPTNVNSSIKGLHYSYNSNEWLTTIYAKVGTTQKLLRRYDYFSNGNVKTITDYKRFISGNTSSYTVKSFEYDKFDRTTKIEYKDSSSDSIVEKYEYTYNKNNFIITENLYNNYTQTTNKNSSTPITNESRRYEYDKNGNQIREIDSALNETKTYSYDADNRMAQAIYVKDGVTTLIQNNLYNGSGQRVQKSENGQSTNYYYQDGNVLYTYGFEDNNSKLEQTPDDYDIKTGITSLNLMETDGEVVSSVRGIGAAESYYFYNKDLQKSTTNVLNAVGQSEVAYEYTDFGETETKGNEDFYNEICYTGGIYDESTALYYLNARYYNPEDGRFITEDTYTGEYSQPSSLHLYAYCHNNPVNNTDPTGHFAWALVSAAWDAYDGAICC